MNLSLSKTLEKRIKRHIHAQPHYVRIVPAPGWIEVCRNEIQDVLASCTQPSKFSPVWSSDPEALGLEQMDFRQIIEIPQRLLTPQQIWWRILDRHVGSFGELVDALQGFAAELYLPAKATLAIKVQSFQSKLYHESKLQDLALEQFAQKGWRTGDGEPIHLLLEQRKNRCSLFLALGPNPLHHRHYKSAQSHQAPLQECLAASALLWWQRLPQQQTWVPDQIVVPFAGSGTLVFESWLLLAKIPPFLWRPDAYGTQLPSMPIATLKAIRQRLLLGMGSLLPAVLIEKEILLAEALDSHLDSFSRGLDQRGQASVARVQCADVFKLKLPQGRRILLPLNPPYGLRLAHENQLSPAAFYAKLGQLLRTWGSEGQEQRGFVLVPDEESLKAIRATLGPGAIQAIQSFTQGGQHIRCVAFQVSN